MPQGKSIRIYLADGSVTGIRYAEVVNWTGQAIICPRSRVSELRDWDEAKRPAAYFLFGFDEASGRHIAYIGEAENIFDRLQSHVANKEFWNEAIFFSNKDENLTKAHVKYIEWKFIELAFQAKRYKLENGNTPQQPTLPRGDRASMEQFIEEARGLLGVLGHRILEPLTPLEPTSPLREIGSTKAHGNFQAANLYLSVYELSARALQTDEGIVVLAGSHAVKETQDSLSVGYLKLRENLRNEGVLAEDGDRLLFLKDHLFQSPSSAAAVIVGYAINGRKHWKNEHGKSLAELEDVQ